MHSSWRISLRLFRRYLIPPQTLKMLTQFRDTSARKCCGSMYQECWPSIFRFRRILVQIDETSQILPPLLSVFGADHECNIMRIFSYTECRPRNFWFDCDGLLVQADEALQIVPPLFSKSDTPQEYNFKQTSYYTIAPGSGMLPAHTVAVKRGK